MKLLEDSMGTFLNSFRIPEIVKDWTFWLSFLKLHNQQLHLSKPQRLTTK